MGFQIADGTGQGKLLKVDNNNRGSVASVSQSQIDLAAITGDKYNYNTGNIILTNATATPVFYLANNGDDDFIISLIILFYGTSTGGTGELDMEIYQNIDSGTIISNAVNPDMDGINYNFGDNNKPADILSYKGATGDTFSGGNLAIASHYPSTPTTDVLSVGTLVLTKGSSITYVVTPQSGNTSMNVQAIAVGFINTSQVQI